MQVLTKRRQKFSHRLQSYHNHDIHVLTSTAPSSSCATCFSGGKSGDILSMSVDQSKKHFLRIRLLYKKARN